jgi:hypothetical protein
LDLDEIQKDRFSLIGIQCSGCHGSSVRITLRLATEQFTP